MSSLNSSVGESRPGGATSALRASDDGTSSSRITAYVLILAGAVARVLSYFYSDNSGGDAWARVSLTALWLQHPNFKVVFDAYPPGQFWLIGLVHLLVPDLTMAARGLSLVLGILSLPVLWRLARGLYGDIAANLALAVFAFYSLHIGYSSTSSGDVCYLFFLLLALQLFFEGMVRRGVWRFPASGVALTIAELTRLEAWAIFLALSIVWISYFWRDLTRSAEGFRSTAPGLLAFGFCGAIGPVFLMIYCWLVFRDPMRILTLHNILVTAGESQPPLAHQLEVIPVTLLVTLCPLALAAALYGLLKSLSFSLRPARQLVGVTLFFAALQNYEIVRGKLLAMPRYSLTLGAMLAVFAGHGLCLAGRMLAPRLRRFWQPVMVGLLALNLLGVLFASEWPSGISEKFATISPRLRYTKYVTEVARYLRSRIGPDDAVLVDDYHSQSHIIAEAVGLPLIPGRRAYAMDTKHEISATQYLTTEHPRFIVYSDQGLLRAFITLPSDCGGVQQVGGIAFRCVLANEIYRVYELTYP